MGQEVCSLSSVMKTQEAFQGISQFIKEEKFCRSWMKNVDNCNNTFRDTDSDHSNAQYRRQHAKNKFRKLLCFQI